jgi:mono/diheme cytochrome c family protein
MNRLILANAILALLIASSPEPRTEARTQAAAQTGTPAGTSHQALLTTYCYSCHNPRTRMGGLTLQGLDPQAVGSDAEIWEKAVRKRRGRQMTPPGCSPG